MMPAAQAGRLLGVDTSYCQRTITDADWAALVAGGVSFAMVKASQGSGTDPCWVRNTASARRSELLLLGAYHVLQPGQDPIAQAQHFADVTETATSMRPVLDFELVKGSTPEAMAVAAVAWCTETKRLWGCDPVIYSYPGFIDSCGATHRGCSALLDLAEYPLWVAHYTQANEPTTPKPWLDWLAWQFDGDGGATMTDGRDCDFSWFRGQPVDLAEQLGRNIYARTDPAPPIDWTPQPRASTALPGLVPATEDGGEQWIP